MPPAAALNPDATQKTRNEHAVCVIKTGEEVLTRYAERQAPL